MKILKPSLFIASIIACNYAVAFAELDLTDPEFMDIADTYPAYKSLKSLSFKFTNDLEGLKNSSVLGFKTINSEVYDVIYQTRIGFNMDGQQRIYIHLDRRCSESNGFVDELILPTNFRNVTYNRYCDGNQYYLTPKSMAGLNYLVSELKKEESIIIEGNDIKLLFNAIGFTASWNGFGGDAL